MDPNVAGMTDRLDRESTRLIAVSQPFAGAWLSLLPVEVRARITSSEFLWAYQRRFGLYLSQPAPVFLQLGAVAGVSYDMLEDVKNGNVDGKVLVKRAMESVDSD